MQQRSKKNAVIVLPTYNERENIEKLIESLEKVFQKIENWNLEILVVDDTSPDGTAAAVKECQKTRPNLHLLEGPKKGLGEAYKRGFSYALTHLHPDYLFQMDADFQHNPHDIPEFLKAADKGYQFIIGSRYIPGGDCPNWEFKRKIYSWLANVGARLIAGIKGISDCTSGYRCIEAAFLRHLNVNRLKSNGYAFQLSLVHAATKKHLKILEIPILFHSRKKGSSKLGKKDIIEFFLNSITLRFRNYK
jgi:dolichol-phosphate mannosyltransferase